MRLITNSEMATVSGGADPSNQAGTPGVYQVVEIIGEKMGFWEKLWYDITTPNPTAADIATDRAYTAAYNQPNCDTTVAATEHGVTFTSVSTISATPSVSAGSSKQGVSITTSVKCNLP